MYLSVSHFHFFFFFQAEDGIRDKLVTGVQTCALPIWSQGLCDVFRADGTERDDAGEPSLINKVCVDYSKEESHSHGRDGIVHVNQDRGALSDPALEHVIEVLTPC